MAIKTKETDSEKSDFGKVPIKDKITLTIEEANAYSGIGINKLYELIRNPKCTFVLYVGKRKLIKRRQFEQFIEKSLEI